MKWAVLPTPNKSKYGVIAELPVAKHLNKGPTSYNNSNIKLFYFYTAHRRFSVQQLVM